MEEGYESAATRMNTLALIGLICGALSCIMGWCCCMFVPLSVAGLVCSIIGLVQINKDPSYSGKGMAITGIVLSVLAVVVSIGISLAINASSGQLQQLIDKLSR